jgi:hypothetical protein
VVLPGDDLVCRRHDRVGDTPVEDADLLVRERGRALDAGEGDDLRRLEAGSGDGEVLHGALGLRTVERVDRNPDLAHRVVLDAIGLIAGVGLAHGVSLLHGHSPSGGV